MVSQPAKSSSTRSLSGYQEVITDPSYAGQIITFTYPHIGNYGANATDNEAARPHARGVIVRDLARRRSNWRSEEDLDDVPRTRQRARYSRASTLDDSRVTSAKPVRCRPPSVVRTRPRSSRPRWTSPAPTTPTSFATVTTPTAYTVGAGPRRVVAYDFGIKTAILDYLGEIATVEVVPASTPAADVLARDPDGVFLSNGPGDPAAVGHITDAIRDLLGEVPSSASVSVTNCSAPPWVATTFKLPVRPPRRQPPRAQPRHRRGRDHEPEPQLRRR